jgi:hypothetical protein
LHGKGSLFRRGGSGCGKLLEVLGCLAESLLARLNLIWYLTCKVASPRKGITQRPDPLHCGFGPPLKKRLVDPLLLTGHLKRPFYVRAERSDPVVGDIQICLRGKIVRQVGNAWEVIPFGEGDPSGCAKICNLGVGAILDGVYEPFSQAIEVCTALNEVIDSFHSRLATQDVLVFLPELEFRRLAKVLAKFVDSKIVIRKGVCIEVQSFLAGFPTEKIFVRTPNDIFKILESHQNHHWTRRCSLKHNRRCLKGLHPKNQSQPHHQESCPLPQAKAADLEHSRIPV